MTPDKIKHLEDLLLAEKVTLESELETVGKRNPDNPRDWEAKSSPDDATSADENDLADTIEDYEGNTAILKQLETRYNEVLKALDKIKNGTYGVCEVCGKPIEEDRLEANPAARTCKEHI